MNKWIMRFNPWMYDPAHRRDERWSADPGGSVIGAGSLIGDTVYVVDGAVAARRAELVSEIQMLLALGSRRPDMPGACACLDLGYRHGHFRSCEPDECDEWHQSLMRFLGFELPSG